VLLHWSWSWRSSRSKRHALLCKQWTASCRDWQSQRLTCNLQQQWQQLDLLQALLLLLLLVLRVVARLQQPKAGRAALEAGLLAGRERHRLRRRLLSLLLLRPKVQGRMSRTVVMRAAARWRSRAHHHLLLLPHARLGLRRPVLMLLWIWRATCRQRSSAKRGVQRA
jgi:hypothetical protein